MLTANRLRTLIGYNPDTGFFRWIGATNNLVILGAEAGTFDRRGYRRISIERRSYMASRLAWLYMTGNWPERDVDHIDGDPANNRWANLREATPAQNMRNRGVFKNNSIGIKGVRLHQSGRYQARICVDGQHRSLGLFTTVEAAAMAYAAAAAKLHGEFARLA